MTHKTDDINFIKGGENLLAKNQIEHTENQLNFIRSFLQDCMNSPNIHFLFGAGTSADAIPPMSVMQEKVEENIKDDTELQTIYDQAKQKKKDEQDEQDEQDNQDGHKKQETNGLEEILNNLYLLRDADNLKGEDNTKTVCLIKKVTETIFAEINVVKVSDNSDKIQENLDLYKDFYQKVTLRHSDLSRVNIFTTNNDLFNEVAMSDLNINYNDGFTSGVKRIFNPAIFNQTLSNKIDPLIEKYKPIQNLVFLYKLHGSINWVYDKSAIQFFPIQQIDPPFEGNENECIIYPTALKQSQSLSNPYSDLIREFQINIQKPNSTLIVMGFSFSDEHINNIIYQALSVNASLNIVIFNDNTNHPLNSIKDNRISFIYGEVEKENVDFVSDAENTDAKKEENSENIHFFKYFVNSLLPYIPQEAEESILRKFIKKYKEKFTDKGVQDD